MYASLGKVAILRVPATTNQAILGIVEAPEKIVALFLRWWLIYMEQHITQLASSNTQDNLNAFKVANIIVLRPPLPEQAAIAAFLDRETAKIAALIAKQERMIALLGEKRQALIAHAVTKGLRADAPMKDSGVAWLGEIPAHWETKRLKQVSPAQVVGIVVNPSLYVSDEGQPFLYGSDIREGKINWQTARRISAEGNALNSKSMLRSGDLVTVRVGYPGVTAVIPEELDGANCASIMVVRRSHDFNSHWLCYVMNSQPVRTQVEIVQYGAAQEQFNISHAVNFLIPTPPRDEQEELVAYLDAELAKIDTLIAKAQQAIALMREHRTSLIAAAVTGKIDVRGEVVGAGTASGAEVGDERLAGVAR